MASAESKATPAERVLADEGGKGIEAGRRREKKGSEPMTPVVNLVPLPVWHHNDRVSEQCKMVHLETRGAHARVARLTLGTKKIV